MTPQSHTVKQAIHTLLHEQLTTWEAARLRYEALGRVQVKEMEVRGTRYKAQCNPARLVSSAAKVDAASLSRRTCFLCGTHRPAEQRSVAWGHRYELLVNPFPIFPRHLTIVDTTHTPQRIAGRMADMMALAHDLDDFTLFYNGPCCGASAPDHAHLQAVGKGMLPIEGQCRQMAGELLDREGKATLTLLADAPRTTLVIRATDQADGVALFERLFAKMPMSEGAYEPMMNVLAMYDASEGWTVCVFPRAKHRPACYHATGNGRLLCSPASVDMGGVFIFPIEGDFLRIEASGLEAILREVCVAREEVKAWFQKP